MSALTGQEIINAFELYVDDTTELSSTEELALLNKVYRKVLTNRPWEFLKSEWSTTTNGTTSITLPSDFSYFIENQNYTDNSMGFDDNKSPKAIFINNVPYRLVNWSDRRQYTNNNNVCYVDVKNGVLKFPVAPTIGLTLSGDYIYKPSNLTLATSPVFPDDFHPMLYHAMAVDDMIIQLFDKARSYQKENEAKYTSYLQDLAYYNSNLVNN